MQLSIDALVPTVGFRKDLEALDDALKQKAKTSLQLLLSNPRAKSLRCHTLKGGGKPTIYKIDLDSNKAYQISFVLDGRNAVLLRVGTHRQIDRDPG